MSNNNKFILAIESSCDDTGASILKNNTVLSNCIASQEIHKSYGGVVPELASRAHQSNIVPVVHQALTIANIDKKDLSAIAYTRGPGLLGSLLVGSSFAKSLSLSLKIPLIEVNHMQAHILCHFIKDERIIAPKFPFIGVTLSGGHTQIVHVNNFFEMKIIGSTLDDAIGEAFDKCGKILGLEYPAGREIDNLAKNGDPNKFKFPIPKAPGLNVSYSGIKTAFLNFINNNLSKNNNFIKQNINDICASIQKYLIQIIINKIEIASEELEVTRIVVGGGVSANSEIKKELELRKKTKNWEIHIPPIEFTTDNAAMVGIVGYYKLLNKDFSNLNEISNPRLTF
jgi:N6-L-threonylcarbamoyladenine synthase